MRSKLWYIFAHLCNDIIFIVAMVSLVLNMLMYVADAAHVIVLLRDCSLLILVILPWLCLYCVLIYNDNHSTILSDYMDATKTSTVLRGR